MFSFSFRLEIQGEIASRALFSSGGCLRKSVYKQFVNSLSVCVCLRLFTILPGRGGGVYEKWQTQGVCKLFVFVFVYGLGRPAASEL